MPKGLLRIHIYDVRSGSEIGTPDWCSHWLLEDMEDGFYILSQHRVRRLEIDLYAKDAFRWEAING